MSWDKLLTNRTVQSHATSRQEIDSLRNLVNRDLKDAELVGLSDDRRFATAYNAVLQLSKMVIACNGYRIAAGLGHHQKSFDAVKLCFQTAEIENLADYFETCRRKRNNIDYDAAEVVTETESHELLKKAREFQVLVEDFIAKNHADFI
jgi:uncharacterized protein (UPF0332 family)